MRVRVCECVYEFVSACMGVCESTALFGCVSVMTVCKWGWQPGQGKQENENEGESGSESESEGERTGVAASVSMTWSLR